MTVSHPQCAAKARGLSQRHPEGELGLQQDGAGRTFLKTARADRANTAATFSQRRETVGNLSAGALCPGHIEGLEE